jgi:drug/metabolite transporter (DMT)-like permease
MASMKTLSRETLGLLLGFCAICMFGATLPMTRLAVLDFDPLPMTAIRVALGGVVAALVLIIARRKLPEPRLWPKLLYVTAAVGTGFQITSAMGSVTVPSAHGGVVLGLLPLCTALVAALWSGERPSLGFWICSVAGAVLITAYALRQGGGGLTVGDLWLLGTVLCASTGYVAMAELARLMPGWVVISWALVINLAVSLPAAVWLWPDDFSRVTPRGWGAFLYLSIVSQYFALFAWNAALAMGGTARVSQIQLLQTFVTIGLAALLAGEAIDAPTLLTAGAVVGLVVVSRRFAVAGRQT